MRQQRCGYNPYLQDSCHVHDGYRIYHPTLDSTHIDVTGGWHDASDYLQYVTTSANAVFQLLLAYEHYPGTFGDAFNASGDPRSEEHTSELQSLMRISYAVFCLKKKTETCT